MKIGTTITGISELPGRWSVWSKSAEQPGARFVVPADDEARSHGVKFASVKHARDPKSGEAYIALIRTDPPLEVIARERAADNDREVQK